LPEKAAEFLAWQLNLLAGRRDDVQDLSHN
jgi:hypothetical protein